MRVHDMQTLDLSTLTDLGPGDMVYRSVASAKAICAERMMISAESGSFYTDWRSAFSSRGSSYYLHKKIGIPAIPTIPFIPDTDDGIVRAVKQLGDFPIIVKMVGGSHGVGVVRVDSLVSLKSLLDYLRSMRASLLLRKYIPHNYYARLIVVGDKVVASHVTYAIEDEFRTNAGEDAKHKREARVFSQEIQDMAVRAVQALGLETGGVDLLFDEHEQPHLAEVNFPHDFSVTQAITGIDVAKAMVEHLINKCRK